MQIYNVNNNIVKTWTSCLIKIAKVVEKVDKQEPSNKDQTQNHNNNKLEQGKFGVNFELMIIK